MILRKWYPSVSEAAGFTSKDAILDPGDKVQSFLIFIDPVFTINPIHKALFRVRILKIWGTGTGCGCGVNSSGNRLAL